MASRIITQLVSDLSGVDVLEGEGETIEFAYRGRNYAIDLTAAEAEKFDKAVSKCVEHARPLGAASGRRRGRQISGEGDPKAIRAWAKSAGLDIPERGRIPSSIREQYTAAH